MRPVFYTKRMKDVYKNRFMFNGAVEIRRKTNTIFA